MSRILPLISCNSLNSQMLPLLSNKNKAYSTFRCIELKYWWWCVYLLVREGMKIYCRTVENKDIYCFNVPSIMNNDICRFFFLNFCIHWYWKNKFKNKYLSTNIQCFDKCSTHALNYILFYPKLIFSWCCDLSIFSKLNKYFSSQCPFRLLKLTCSSLSLALSTIVPSIFSHTSIRITLLLLNLSCLRKIALSPRILVFKKK